MAGEGILFVVSAPSGTGKSTVTHRLIEAVTGLAFSVSFTTREPRTGEIDGKDYHFVDRSRFEAMVTDGAFLEWAEVYNRMYGTGLAATREALATGMDLVLDVDVQGARKVRRGLIPAVEVMILPPDYATLESRLVGRGSETEDARDRRLAEARQEAQEFREFDYVVVNDSLDQTVNELAAIVSAERRRSDRCVEQVERIIDTFPS
jgi:guanylate kinase